MKIPASFTKHRPDLSWPQISWAYERGIVDWRYLVQKAIERLEAGSEDEVELELAGLSPAEAGEAGSLLARLAPGGADDTAKATWLCINLSWLYENKDAYEDPLQIVEEIYSDFGYPEQIASFIRYMPPRDGYDPSRHSSRQNIDRLFQKWEEYVSSC